jgi:glucose/mannose transport system permease protein
MPAVFMTQMAFHRSEIGLASASAIMMFLTVSAIVVPYLYSELKREDDRK